MFVNHKKREDWQTALFFVFLFSCNCVAPHKKKTYLDFVQLPRPTLATRWRSWAVTHEAPSTAKHCVYRRILHLLCKKQIISNSSSSHNARETWAPLHHTLGFCPRWAFLHHKLYSLCTLTWAEARQRSRYNSALRLSGVCRITRSVSRFSKWGLPDQWI